MALSNWDCLEVGDQTMGDFTIEIYKNYLVVEKGDDRMVINSGDISMGSLNIHAKRGLQNGIYVYISHGYGEDKKNYAGIGCYGFGDLTIDYLRNTIGLTDDEIGDEDDWFQSSTNFHNGEMLNGFVELICNISGEKQYLVEEDVELSPFVGVTKETLDDFIYWLNSKDMKYEIDSEWLESIDWNNVERYNKGDAFFIGVDNAKSKIGDQEDGTILTKLIKGGE